MKGEMKMIKRIILAVLASLIISVSASASCWNVISEKIVAPGVVHEFVDRDCDWNADIVQEYRYNGYGWVMTRWWQL
jgi:hypothetical protein